MDYDIIPGRSSENAKKALALAEERGFDATDVKTSRDGYHVPIDLDAEKAEEKPAAPKTARKRTAKKE